MILQRRRYGLQGEGAVRVLHRFLQVEVLDREMIVAIAIAAANRGIVGLAHRVAHSFLVADVTLDRRYRAVDELGGVVGLGGVERGIAAILGAEIRDKFLVRVVG